MLQNGRIMHIRLVSRGQIGNQSITRKRPLISIITDRSSHNRLIHNSQNRNNSDNLNKQLNSARLRRNGTANINTVKRNMTRDYNLRLLKNTLEMIAQLQTRRNTTIMPLQYASKTLADAADTLLLPQLLTTTKGRTADLNNINTLADDDRLDNSGLISRQSIDLSVLNKGTRRDLEDFGNTNNLTLNINSIRDGIYRNLSNSLRDQTSRGSTTLKTEGNTLSNRSTILSVDKSSNRILNDNNRVARTTNRALTLRGATQDNTYTREAKATLILIEAIDATMKLRTPALSNANRTLALNNTNRISLDALFRRIDNRFLTNLRLVSIVNTRFSRITAQNSANLNGITDRQLNRLNKISNTMTRLSDLMTIEFLNLRNNRRINKRISGDSKRRRTILIPCLKRTRFLTRRDLTVERGTSSSLAT